MHFTTLLILKGETLENTSLYSIEDIFGDRFCYHCGETRPMYQYWCDWFDIGGRWQDILSANKGIRCEKHYSDEKKIIKEGMFSVAEIKDLTEPLPVEEIYSVATKSRIYKEGTSEFERLVARINKKEFNGIVAVIDCHD